MPIIEYEFVNPNGRKVRSLPNGLPKVGKNYRVLGIASVRHERRGRKLVDDVLVITLRVDTSQPTTPALAAKAQLADDETLAALATQLGGAPDADGFDPDLLDADGVPLV